MWCHLISHETIHHSPSTFTCLVKFSSHSVVVCQSTPDWHRNRIPFVRVVLPGYRHIAFMGDGTSPWASTPLDSGRCFNLNNVFSSAHKKTSLVRKRHQFHKCSAAKNLQFNYWHCLLIFWNLPSLKMVFFSHSWFRTRSLTNSWPEPKLSLSPRRSLRIPSSQLRFSLLVKKTTFSPYISKSVFQTIHEISWVC